MRNFIVTPKLTLHPTAADILNKLQASPPQSLLIYGDRGVGLFEVAKMIAAKNPIIVTPSGESQTLSIKTERIRELYDETKNTAKTNQFVIIDEADTMTRAAQSTFLKLLEEPNQHTYFILTTHSKDSLLPTIISRVQAHYLPLPTTQQTAQLIHSLTDDTVLRQKIAFLAPRHPSLIHTYIKDSEAFELDAKQMSDARQCLSSSSSYDRQVIALKTAGSRTHAISFIDACLQIMQFSLQAGDTSFSPARIERYLDARDAIERNGNTKLVLANLMV